VRRQWTLGQYRGIDLTLFALMLTASELIITSAATRWFPEEPYTVSAAAAIAAIVMMRWGPWAAVHAVLGGVVACFAARAPVRQYLVYGLGNLLCLAGLGVRKALGGDSLREDALKTLAYGTCVLLLMQLGRAAIALVLGASLAEAAGFFATDVVSWLFTLLILWIARRQDGILEDQKHYLLRVQKEQEEEKGGV